MKISESRLRKIIKEVIEEDDYSELEPSMDKDLKDFNNGKNVLHVEYEWEIEDYFGPLEGMPVEVPMYIKSLHFLNKDQSTSLRYDSGLLDPEFFYKIKYIPMLKAIVLGLEKEKEHAVSQGYYKGSLKYSIDSHIDDYQAQLDILSSQKH